MPARFDLVAPRADALMESLRATGYSLPDAVSDIIDNSITAGGRNIWMNFQWAGADSWVSILDDGRGMSESGLIDAMRIGSRSPREVREPSDLGRYGLGLKTASISQARSLTVATHVSKQRGMNTRQWDLDHLASTGDWQLLNVPASLLPACLCDTSPEQLARTFTLANDLSGGPTQARPGSRFDRAARGRSQVRNGWSRHGGRCRRWNRRRCWPGGRPWRPPGSGWPPWLPDTAGTWFSHGRSSGTGGFPVGPATPAGAPPPRGVAGTRQRPRSAAGRGPAVTALPAGAVAPFVPYPGLPPRTGTAAGTLHRPPRRIGRPLNGKSRPVWEERR